MLTVRARYFAGFWVVVIALAMAACGPQQPPDPPGAPQAANNHVSLVYEAEDLPLRANAPAGTQTNCCDVVWSNNAQVWFRATDANQSMSMEFNVPYDDTYAISAVETRSFDYGNTITLIDGAQVGPVFYGYSPTVVKTDWIALGTVQLSRGLHTFTVTVVGKASTSRGFFAGIDRIWVKS